MAVLQSPGPSFLFSAVAFGLLVVAIVLVWQSIELVEAYEKRALTVRGEYRTLLGPGVNFVTPFVSETERIDVRTQRLTVDVETTTRDTDELTARARVEFRVTDAETVYLETDDWRDAAAERVERGITEILGDLETGTIRSDDLAERVRERLDRRTGEIGITVESVTVEDLTIEETEFDDW